MKQLGGLQAIPDYTGLTGSLTIFNQKLLELLLFRMIEESGVRLLLHSYLYDVVVSDDLVRQVMLVGKSGKALISGDVFVDCTGDGDLAYLAGVPFEQASRQVTQPTLEFRVEC